jgi:hypothetical protein
VRWLAVRFNVAIALLNRTRPGACFVGLRVQYTYGPGEVGIYARTAGTGQMSNLVDDFEAISHFMERENI